MKTKFHAPSFLPVAFLLALAVAFTMPAARSAEAEKTVVIIANDTLKFSITQIQASPGQSVHVQLRNEGTLPKDSMGHNWILLDDEAVAMPYAMAAMTARDANYKPKALAAHVLAAIPLLGPKEVGDVTFNAPTKPGKYPFICSCTGHCMAGMRGDLIVK
jgi:azurin